ncbi:unnamed protein product, partial [Phaeothamnion confervicola]
DDVDPTAIVLASLATWDRPATADVVHLDPELGRVAFATGSGVDGLRATYACEPHVAVGLPDRGDDALIVPTVRVRTASRIDPGDTFVTLEAALRMRHAESKIVGDVVVELCDSGTHLLPPPGQGASPCVVPLAAGASLQLIAQDGEQPVI